MLKSANVAARAVLLVLLVLLIVLALTWTAWRRMSYAERTTTRRIFTDRHLLQSFMSFMLCPTDIECVRLRGGIALWAARLAVGAAWLLLWLLALAVHAVRDAAALDFRFRRTRNVHAYPWSVFLGVPTTMAFSRGVWRSVSDAERNVQSKIFWKGVFEAHGAPTPATYGVLSKGRYRSWAAVPPGPVPLLWKPVEGTGGFGIVYCRGGASCMARRPADGGDYVLQRRITMGAGGTAAPHRVRLVTARGRDGRVSVLERAAVIRRTGYRCRKLECQQSTRQAVPAPLRARLTRLAARMHRAVAARGSIIGWDVLVDSAGAFYFLEGNVGPQMCVGVTTMPIHSAAHQRCYARNDRMLRRRPWR